MTHAVQRPHATDQMLQRQGSFRIFNKLQDTSPFKRQMSLRLNDLPSTLERYQELSEPGRGGLNGHVNGPGGGKISSVGRGGGVDGLLDKQMFVHVHIG